MWTSTLDLKLNRVLLTRLLGLVYPKIYYSALSPLCVANIPRPTLPAASWVRVRNLLAGISGNDLPLVRADADVRTSVAALPNAKLIYPGHEVVGEVIEIGEDVQYLRVGDRVVLQYRPNCLSSGAKPVCRTCTAGNYNLCEYGPLPGPQPIGGGWSEEMLLHEQQLFRLPSDVSDEQGVMLEPTAIALHALLRCLPQANDNVLIVGAGTIGLLTLHLLHTLVPKARVSIFARHSFQVEQATRLGADHIIYPIDPYASVQRVTHSHLYKGILGNRTITGGFDVIYDTIGQRNTLHHALRWLGTRGTVVLVGLGLHMMHIDLTPIWHQESDLLGSLSHGEETWPLGTSSQLSTFGVVTELIQQKRIQPEQLITDRFALNNYKDALIAAEDKKHSQSIKVIFDYALLPASAVPNIRASARPQRPELVGPQGETFMEEFLQAQNATGLRQEPEQEAVPQANGAEQTLSPKVLDTPSPQAFPKDAWDDMLNREEPYQDKSDREDTDATIPRIKRLPYSPRVSPRVVEYPQTPIPPAMEPTPSFMEEPPETKIDGFEANSHSSEAIIEPQQAGAGGEFALTTDHTFLEFPVELPTDEEESIRLSSEITSANPLTQEQLPSQTVLDNLDADTSSTPEFLAQLSNLGALVTPVISTHNAEGSVLSDFSLGAVPTENAEGSPGPDASAIAPSAEQVEEPLVPGDSTTAQSIENAEDTIAPDASAAIPSAGQVEEPLVPDPSVTAQPTENAEDPLTPDVSASAVALDSVDQVGGEQTNVIPSLAQPKAKRKRRTAKGDQVSATMRQEEQGKKS